MSAARRMDVVFDLDGTLIDSIPDVAGALNSLLAEEGPTFVCLQVPSMWATREMPPGMAGGWMSVAKALAVQHAASALRSASRRPARRNRSPA